VRYRDALAALPFILQAGLFLSPVAYPLSEAGETASWVLALNPVSGIIESWRWALLGTSPNEFALATSGVLTLALTLFAWRYFAKEEVHFADRI
jgi:lipopolysaccharide transport system permease protein